MTQDEYEQSRIKKFWECVNKTEDCWLWTAAIDAYGYGQFSGWSTARAHRISWELKFGFVPWKSVLHKCDVRACVNPDHLFLGNQADNMRDMAAKGRNFSPNGHQTHCPQEHEYTPENTYVWRNKRACRTCKRIQARIRRASSKS